MAHKKGQGSSRNGRDSNGQRRGVKVYGGQKVQPGSIVLFHNAAENTPEALPGILEALLADGYRILPISELLLQGDCFIDSSGRQCRQ